jgi:hypothetical protein
MIMKRQLILLAIAAFLVIPICASANERAQLQVKRDDTVVLTLRFSDGSLALFNEIPSQLISVLREHGIDCCSSQQRVNEALWRCCHGKFAISSSDTRLQSLLAAAFTGSRVVQQ